MHEHSLDERRDQFRPKGARIDDEFTPHLGRMAADGRSDLVRPDDVLGLQRLTEERIFLQIDLPDGEVVRRAPIGVDVGELGRGQWQFGHAQGSFEDARSVAPWSAKCKVCAAAISTIRRIARS